MEGSNESINYIFYELMSISFCDPFLHFPSTKVNVYWLPFMVDNNDGANIHMTTDTKKIK